MSDQKKVEEIHKLFVGLEQESKDGSFDSMFLAELIQMISDLEKSEDPILKKLAKYKDSLTAQMTVRHLATIAVPFERYLKKSMTDSDFLISSFDRDHLVTPRVPLHFIIDNMRSAFNVGSIFRTADTMGAQKIWLTGYTPTPHQTQVERAALGAAFVMEWEQKNFQECIQDLAKKNFRIIALETAANAVDISMDFEFENPTVFVIGNERFGLDKDQLEMAHEVRKIPTFGIKNSLNAAVAAAIAGYEWRKQFNEQAIKV
jgi:23S rRNA (guanosine2251-2'-O)-methyltransferase